MSQQHLSLQNVQVLQLYDLIKKYLQDLKLEIGGSPVSVS